MHIRQGMIGLATAVAVLALGAPASVLAASITVTTTTDTLAAGQCSLRAAISAANTDAAVGGCPAGSGADTVRVPAGHYTLTLAGPNEDADATGDLDLMGATECGRFQRWPAHRRLQSVRSPWRPTGRFRSDVTLTIRTFWRQMASPM